MTGTVAEALLGGGLVLDGGLATRLEARGHDLSSDLWSARLLAEQPEEVLAAHRDYFDAGARFAITASYQASFEGLAGHGLDHAAAADLMQSSVRLAVRAREELADDGLPRWVAASVGPYGAALADGSEYRGDYGLTVDQLRAWHRPRLAVLMDSGADLLALETVPDVAEAQALVAEMADSGMPAWLSLTCSKGRTRAGEPVSEAFAVAAGVDEIVAVGINCTDPREIAALIPIAAAASGKPVVVYPNSGETWDADARRWTGTPGFDAALVRTWLDAGAAAVGGCCRVGPEQIREIATVLQRD